MVHRIVLPISPHPACGHLLPRSQGRRDIRTTAVEAKILDRANYVVLLAEDDMLQANLYDAFASGE